MILLYVTQKPLLIWFNIQYIPDPSEISSSSNAMDASTADFNVGCT